jgi:hypothetical protein
MSNFSFRSKTAWRSLFLTLAFYISVGEPTVVLIPCFLRKVVGGFHLRVMVWPSSGEKSAFINFFCVVYIVFVKSIFSKFLVTVFEVAMF